MGHFFVILFRFSQTFGKQENGFHTTHLPTTTTRSRTHFFENKFHRGDFNHKCLLRCFKRHFSVADPWVRGYIMMELNPNIYMHLKLGQSPL